MKRIDEILQAGVNYHASDVHLKAGDPPIVRVDGQLYPLKNFSRLEAAELKAMAEEIMGPLERERYADFHEVDFAYGVSGLGRFRVNAYQQRGTTVMVLRSIPYDILTLDELNLPPVIEKLAKDTHRGMILVTGTTGCGKSTTLASMIDYINRHRSVNIITIEDPIEYLHQDRLSIVNQREVGFDTTSFSLALRSALRQDPDVILVGEMRDLETISAALTAAETGHLVFATLHTNSSTESINRIIDVFPPHQQGQVRAQLSLCLEAVLTQKLLQKKTGGGMILAAEVMTCTPAIRALIRDNKIHEMYGIIQVSRRYGMNTMNQALYELVSKGLISGERALTNSNLPEELEKMLGKRPATASERERLIAQKI